MGYCVRRYPIISHLNLNPYDFVLLISVGLSLVPLAQLTEWLGPSLPTGPFGQLFRCILVVSFFYFYRCFHF